MKTHRLILGTLILTTSIVHGADASKYDQPFAHQAAESVGLAIFKTIGDYYKSEMGAPGGIKASTNYPVKIVFSKSDTGDLPISWTNNATVLLGKVNLSEKVTLIPDGSDSDSKPKSPDGFFQVTAYWVKSGNFNCSGTFTVNGKAIAIQRGEIIITGEKHPIRFSDESKLVLDAK